MSRSIKTEKIRITAISINPILKKWLRKAVNIIPHARWECICKKIYPTKNLNNFKNCFDRLTLVFLSLFLVT